MVNIINTEPLDVFEHMAADELCALDPGLTPTFRIFNWKEDANPSATFGYAQFYSEVKKQMQAQGIKKFTRRPTGGGIVPHRDDLTFSLVFAEDKLLKPKEIYLSFHDAIREAFAENTFLRSHNSAQNNYLPSYEGEAMACFANPVQDDLLGPEGDKVLGGAIRRYGGKVLYQGSFQIPCARINPVFKKLLIKAVCKFLKDDILAEKEMSAERLSQVKETAVVRYATGEWIEKF